MITNLDYIIYWNVCEVDEKYTEVEVFHFNNWRSTWLINSSSLNTGSITAFY